MTDAHHDDSVMSDVPPPHGGVHGRATHSAAWPRCLDRRVAGSEPRDRVAPRDPGVRCRPRVHAAALRDARRGLDAAGAQAVLHVRATVA